MSDGLQRSDEAVLETERMVLRRWQVSDAGVQRELWAERDRRAPPHRRLSADGHPTLAELEERIRGGEASAGPQLLAAVEKSTGAVIGYCGLIANAHGDDDEPELAYEFLRRAWGRGYATEAATAVLTWAELLGSERLWATIRDWNTASRRVAEKIGFVLTHRVDVSADYGDLLYYLKAF